MVTVIKTGTSIRRILQYNEQKVAAGVADCLLAANYPKDVECLTPTDKLHRLLRQAALNEKVTRNSVHISLNFAPTEQFSPDRLREIAAAYMQGIGFGDQPYLVYQHHDAGHPHLHLVSVKVRADGSRIDMHNIGRRQSENARQAIERSFGLVQARAEHRSQELRPLPAQRVHYGRTETRRAMQAVLDAVLPHYRYTSLPELNAVLGLYHVAADRGSEHSRIYRHQGLTYRVLDKEGRKTGVPIKANAFYSKPTLAYLQERFTHNQGTRLPYRARLRNKIDLALLRYPGQTLQQLSRALEKEGVHVVLRQNAAGQVYGITYIDHQTKTVFNGSSLGKPYSAKGLQERCAESTRLQAPRLSDQQAARPHAGPDRQTVFLLSPVQPSPALSGTGHVADALLQPEQLGEYVLAALRRNRRKKKRKRIADYS